MKIEDFEKEVKEWIGCHIVANDISKQSWFSTMVLSKNRLKEITIIMHVDTVPSLSEKDLYASGENYQEVYKQILKQLKDNN